MLNVSLRRAVVIALFLLFVEVNNKNICTATSWPTLGSSAQHKPDTRTWLHNSNSMSDRVSVDGDEIRHGTCQCNFFIWNFISYIKFKETTFQVKENTIEGLGGKRFVRVKPGSLLERWYPQLKANQLKSDGCLLCGHSFREHLEYWWWCKKRSSRCYSKFESFIRESENNADKQGPFYSKYVDVLTTDKRGKHYEGLEVRTSFEGDVSYVIPPFNPLSDGKPKRVWSVLMLALARTAALVRLEDLIWLERNE